MLYPLSYGGGRTSATHCAMIEIYKYLIRIANQLQYYKNLDAVCAQPPKFLNPKSQNTNTKQIIMTEIQNIKPVLVIEKLRFEIYL